MADILTFYGFRKRGAAAVDSEKLQFAPETRDATQGHTPNGLEAHLAVSQAGRPCDWTNQELADLYRVEALLTQANVRIETTRGTSDEGDPWFVFCRADGEVFVHLARIDGMYVLDSPKLDVVLSGPSFAALIDRFSNAVVLCAPTGNIVQLRPFSRNSVVRIHPAAMLAALVWSLYLASDQMVGSAQAGELSPGADGAHLTPIAGLDVDAGADNAQPRLEADRKIAAVDNHAPVTAQTDHFRVSAISEGYSCNVASAAAGIAIGLTTIAISFGLYDRDFETTHNTARLEMSEGLQGTSDLAHATSLPLSFTPIEKSLSEIKDANSAESVAAVTNPTGLALNGEHLRDVAMQVEAEIPVDKVAQSAAEKGPWPLAVDKAVVTSFSHSFSSQASDFTEAASSAEPKDLQVLITLATEHLGQLSSYDIVGLKVDATFDVSTLSKQVAEFVLADLSGGPESTDKPLDNAQSPDNLPHAGGIAQFLPYDDAAKSFVYQFLLKSDTIEAIRSGNSVVFFDTTLTGDPNDQAYTVSWMTADHTIVSTIGHAYDFADLVLA